MVHCTPSWVLFLCFSTNAIAVINSSNCFLFSLKIQFSISVNNWLQLSKRIIETRTHTHTAHQLEWNCRFNGNCIYFWITDVDLIAFFSVYFHLAVFLIEKHSNCRPYRLQVCLAHRNRWKTKIVQHFQSFPFGRAHSLANELRKFNWKTINSASNKNKLIELCKHF